MNLRKKTLAIVVLAMSGCAHQQVKSRASYDLSCGADSIYVSDVSANAFGACGCGKKATYVATQNGIILNSPITEQASCSSSK
jgi:hypothetical protein